MSELCLRLHAKASTLLRHRFPFDPKLLPQDGIYIVFEKGEVGHGGDRITRIGTHTGVQQLRSRLEQHFLRANKDRSIFRKNVGRCLLNCAGDLFLASWNVDLTTKVSRVLHPELVGSAEQKRVENRVTEYVRDRLSFCTIRVDDKSERLRLEEAMIATVAQCSECGPSGSWLGLSSPIAKIVASGLWQVQCLDATPLNESEWHRLDGLI